MKRSPTLDAATAELDAANVPYDVEWTKTHVHIRYGEDLQHKHVVSATPSDRRAPLNERAAIRRELQAKGYLERGGDIIIKDVALVDLKDGEARCFSYNIAEHFGKAHKNVLSAIDKIRAECGSEFDRLNFKPIDYVDAKGRKYRAYSMTRDGFSLVVMGFTGSAATQWKIKYIDAFNEMASELAAISDSPEVSRLSGEVDAMASMLADMETRLEAQPVQRKTPFIRPSLTRQQRKDARAARRVSA